MIDITVVGIYSLVTSALGVGAHIATHKKLAVIQEALKTQRIELTAVEALTVIGIGVQAIENHMWRKDFTKMQETTGATLVNLNNRLNDLSNRVNDLGIDRINDKLDSVMYSINKEKKKKKD